MKGLVTKKLRAGLSLFLAAVMAFSTPCSALAVEEEPKPEINYVSLGDSMANGYGFVGYHQNSNDRNVYDLMTGKGMYGEGAYPLQFEEYLTEQGYEVNHTKLATSAMLAEDLLFLLDGREEFDDGWNGFKDYVGTYSIEELKAHFQKAITEADIMTMGIGNASFGAFMLDRVTSALGVMGGSLEGEPVLNFEEAIAVLEMDDEQHALAMEIYNTLLEKLVENVPEDIVEDFNLKTVVDIVAYTAAAYLVNNTLLMDKIIEMNPDAEIVLVGLLNTTYGMNITDEEGNVLVPFGDTMDFAFDVLNAYMAGLPAVKQAQGEWKDAKFYFAEQPNPLFICQEFENLSNNDWGDIQDGRLSGETVRQRNIDAFNDSLSEIMGAPFAAGINAAVPGVVKDMLAKMNPGWNDLDDAAQQKLINATIAEKNLLITEETHGENYKYFLPIISLTDVENFEDNQPEEFVEGGNFNVDENRKNLAIALYLGIERGVAESTDTMSIPLEGLIAIATNIETAFDGFSTNLESPVSVAQEMGDYLTTGDVLKGMCKVYGLFKVGNGMSVHPTPEGHDKIAASVINAYETGHTATDETLENLEVVLGILADLVAEYGDDAAAYAYNYAKENGYIEMAEKALAELEAQLVILKAEAEKLAGEAKVEAEKLIAEAEEAIVALHESLKAEAKEFNQKLINQIEKQLNILEESVKALVEIMIEEGTEAAQKAAEEALAALEAFSEAAIVKFQEALKVGAEWLLEKAGTTYAEFVEAATAAVKKYAPEAADAMYNWLYNNPEKVIAFFNEYGDDIVGFLVENGEPIVMVLGYLAVTYGDEVVDYVVAHPEALLALVDWYKEHGDNMWALIDVYAKELGFYDLIADVVEDVKNVDLTETLKALQDILKQYGPEALDQIIKFMEESGCLDKLEEYAKELQAKAEAQLKELVENVKPQIEAAIKDLEAQLEALEAELAAKKAELAQKLEELKAMLEEQKAQLENASEELKAEIEAAIKEIEAAIEALENAIAEIEAKIAEIKNAIAELNDKLETIVEEIEALVKAAEELNAAIKELVGIVSGEIEGSIEDAAEKLQDAIAKVTEAIENAEELIDSINTAIKSVVEFIESIPGSIEALENAFDAAVENAKDALVDALENLKDGLTDALEGAADDLKDALTDAIDGIVNDIETKVDELLDVLDAEIAAAVTGMLNDAANALKDAANGLSDDAMALLGEVVDQVKDILDAIILDATTDEYEVSEDSYYVALGDKSTYAYGLEEGTDGYVERFAKALGLTEEQYNNLCKDCECASVADCLAETTEHAAEIAKADLVTVGFTNNAYMEFALGQVVNGYMGEDVVDPDWSALLPEEAVALIEEKLAEINQELVAAGMTPEMAGLVTLAVESYAYAYVEYAVELPTLVGAIHEINPEATVIIVGMYNPLSGAMIAQDGVEIAFGDYIDMIIEVSDVYGTAYAALAPNTIFVSAPEVETIQPAGTMDILELAYEYVMYGGKNLYASEDGHEYIKDQLLGALDITVVEEPEQPVGLLGDVNCDAKVNAADVNLLFRHVNGTLTTEISAQGLINADVNFDGKLNAADVNKLFRYVNGALDSLE